MVRFNKPTIRRKDMDSVLQTMVDEKIGPGEKTDLFNNYFCALTLLKYSKSYRSYLTCIRNAFLTLGADSCSLVAMSALTPSVYKTVCDQMGLRTVILDVDKENGLVSSKALLESGADILVLYESCSSLPVHYDMVTTYPVRVEYENVRIIEDITQSIGSQVGEEILAGSFGDAVVCRLEDEDLVSCAGGAVLGVTSSYVDSLKALQSSQFDLLTDLNASLGIVQIQNLLENMEKRREIISIYQSSLSKTRHKRFGLTLLDFIPSGSVFSVFLDSKPEESIKFALKHDIPLVMTFKDSIIKECDGDMFEKYPVSAAYYCRCVSFPLYPFLKNQEIDSISKIIAHLP